MILSVVVVVDVVVDDKVELKLIYFNQFICLLFPKLEAKRNVVDDFTLSKFLKYVFPFFQNL